MEYVSELISFLSTYHPNLLLQARINTNQAKHKITPKMKLKEASVIFHLNPKYNFNRKQLSVGRTFCRKKSFDFYCPNFSFWNWKNGGLILAHIFHAETRKQGLMNFD